MASTHSERFLTCHLTLFIIFIENTKKPKRIRQDIVAECLAELESHLNWAQELNAEVHKSNTTLKQSNR